MKKFLVLVWLLLPLPLVVLHFGRGQQWLALDRAHTLVRQGQLAERAEDWARADADYLEAARGIPPENRDLKLRLDLARIRTRYRMGDAVAAIDQSDKLVNDPALAAMPPEFQRESRELAGRIHYYAAWVMRLEGARRELWMEEAELSRQNFRLVAEKSSADGEREQAARQQENLESAVQLQRLSLTELMARPLPREGKCMSGQGLSEQMGKRRGQRGKGLKPGDEEGPPDKGAGMKRFEPGQGS